MKAASLTSVYWDGFGHSPGTVSDPSTHVHTHEHTIELLIDTLHVSKRIDRSNLSLVLMSPR